ncbi:MAG: hypothetical protein ACKO3P_19255 [Planctomycetaceae bacterium]
MGVRETFRRHWLNSGVGLCLLALLVSSPFLALGQVAGLCDDCQQCAADPTQWCATCRRVCGEKTTSKTFYRCREKTYCQHRTPCLFESEECLECECAPRTRRVLVKKSVKQTKSVWKCEVDDPNQVKPAPAREPSPVPPAPAADPATPEKAAPEKTAPEKTAPEKGPASPRPATPRTASGAGGALRGGVAPR